MSRPCAHCGSATVAYPGNALKPNPADHLFYVRILIERADKIDRTKVFDARPLHTVLRAVVGMCGVPLCDLCAQDPDGGHHYCPDHWTIRTLEMAA